MRAIVQRVHAAHVEVDGQIVGQIGRGLCCYIGAGKGDDEDALAYVADKLLRLRIFPSEDGKMNDSVIDIGASVLLISQFTLYADVRRGRRPSFSAAMPPEPAEDVFNRFVERIRNEGVDVQTGTFGATMRVVSDGDGPVNILIDSAKSF